MYTFMGYHKYNAPKNHHHHDQIMEHFQHLRGTAGLWAVQLVSYAPSSSNERSSCSVSSSPLCIVSDGHSAGYKVVSHCGLNLRFPAGQCNWGPFCVFLGHLDIFREVPVHVHCPFFKIWVFCLFLIYLYEVFVTCMCFLYLVAYLFTLLKVFVDEQILNFNIV